MKPTLVVLKKSAALLAELDEISRLLAKKSYMEAADANYKKLANSIIEDVSILKGIGQYFGYSQRRILKRIEGDLPGYRSSLGEFLKR